MSLKLVEKFINQIPWLPDDIKVKIRKNSVQFKPKKETAKFDEKLFEVLSNVIYGATYYDLWLKKAQKKDEERIDRNII